MMLTLVVPILCVVSLGLGLSSGQDCQYENYANYEGILTKAGTVNLQDDAVSCCASCRTAGQATCDTWVWCPDAGGCDDGGGTIYGYQECALKLQNLASGGTVQAYQRGKGNTKFISGIVNWNGEPGLAPGLSTGQGSVILSATITAKAAGAG